MWRSMEPTCLPMTLAARLAAQADRLGGKCFFHHGGMDRSYAAVAESAGRLAAGLRALGVGKGDRVATYLPNGLPLVESYFALATLGAGAVLLNPQLTPREIGYILEDSGAKGIITHASLLPNVRAVRGTLLALRTVVVAGGAAEDGAVAFEALGNGMRPLREHGVNPEDEAWLAYTSGTTGKPKGAVLTHRNLLWTADVSAPTVGFHADDVILCPIPLFHLFALGACFLEILTVGATTVIHDRFSPEGVLEAIGQHKVTIFPGVPTMYAYLLNSPALPTADTRSLRFGITGGAIMPQKLIEQTEASLGIQVINMYGITETASWVACVHHTVRQPFGSVGKAMPGLTVRVVDRDDRDVPVGQIGEIVVSGPNVMRGYNNLPQATAEAMRGGFYHTGDLGTLDADGFVYVLDRLTDMIISGGYNIYPKEIEDVLYTHPAVLEAAVIGVPHEAKGEVPRAYVVLKEGAAAAPDEILAYLRGQLAAYKLPVSVEVIAAIPKTGSGKIRRVELRDRAAAKEE
jgi:long-chain acyl-CoA synthetase